MCTCDVCTDYHLFQQNMIGIPLDKKEFFEDLYDRLVTCECELEYYKMKYTALKAEGGSDVNPV